MQGDDTSRKNNGKSAASAAAAAPNPLPKDKAEKKRKSAAPSALGAAIEGEASDFANAQSAASSSKRPKVDIGKKAQEESMGEAAPSTEKEEAAKVAEAAKKQANAEGIASSSMKNKHGKEKKTQKDAAGEAVDDEAAKAAKKQANSEANVIPTGKSVNRVALARAAELQEEKDASAVQKKNEEKNLIRRLP